MIRCIIFDLSDVLIAGLRGIEKRLSRELALPEDQIRPCFGGNLIEELCLGNISEETYLKKIIEREGWQIEIARLQAIIRKNFHNQVDGTLPILMDLAPQYDLVLHSDHAREWISYIKSIHPFLKLFKRSFFSFELKRLKNDPDAFLMALDAISLPPQSCLFIDDNPANVEAAESVGIPSIHFLDATQLAVELERFVLLA